MGELAKSIVSYLDASFVAVFPVWALLLRVWVGGMLLVYALRSSFGFFPNTGVPVQTISGTAAYMNKFGWQPGIFR
jgi:putative oxidoreductase